MPFADNHGVRIHYETEGDGQPLVLYHGAGASLEVWRELGYVAALRQKCRLILLDARGHGQSDRPHDSGAYQMSLLVSDVLAVLDDAGVDKAHFLGYSMGGRVGFGIAKYGPERFCSLIIGGSHPYRAEAMASAQEMEMLERGFGAYVAGLEAEGVQLPAAVKARLLAMDSEALLASTIATIEDGGYEEILANIELPCLLFVGENDGNYAGAAECAKFLKDAEFLVFPGLDHAELYRRSDLVAPEVMRFLATVT
jgi:pimeloyl-ACP methyl ester carboxylesterase